MRAEAVIPRLKTLLTEAGEPTTLLESPPAAAEWRTKLRALLVAALGEQHRTVRNFDALDWVGPSTSIGAATARKVAFLMALSNAAGFAKATIYELEMRAGDDDLVDESSYDPALWAHVKQQVEDRDWGKVASLTTIFVEDKMRRWAGLDGGTYGDALYATVLGPAADLRLGSRAGEYEGWRNLGTGFAKAIGNVERHHINDRPDAQRYAIGVLGLASLLLTQMRYQHPEATREAEAGNVTDGITTVARSAGSNP